MGDILRIFEISLNSHLTHPRGRSNRLRLQLWQQNLLRLSWDGCDDVNKTRLTLESILLRDFRLESVEVDVFALFVSFQQFMHDLTDAENHSLFAGQADAERL